MSKNPDDTESLSEEQHRHRMLKDRIAEAFVGPKSDQLTLAELKRRKLLVKDAMGRLRGQDTESTPRHQASREWTTRVTSGGRVVLPADARAALGLTDGSPVRVCLEDGRVTISPIEAIVRDIQNRWRSYIPGDRSLVDELIADRRREAERE